MANPVALAFETKTLVVPLDEILPTRKVEVGQLKSPNFARIAASISELGIIEPLVVYPQKAARARFILLDGHLRYEVLKRRGDAEAVCLIATDDEAFTYNHKVNRVPPIQEHFMILKAIEHGVSEERIAKTLNVDTSRIRQKRDLLRGICPEAVELLKERHISEGAIREMKRVSPMRQIEIAELMISSSNYSAAYAKCLFAATPQHQLADPLQAKEVPGLRPDDIARMEGEMGKLERDFKLIEESYGRNVLTLVIAVGYLRKLLENAAVVRFLSSRYADVLAEFKKLLKTVALEDGHGDSAGAG